MKSKKVIKIVSIIAAVICVLLGGLAVITIKYIKYYTDTNTWATIVVDNGLQASEDGFISEEEYLKGDSICIGSATLEIEDITHEGETTLSVQSGDVYNSNGESVKTFVINYDKQAGLTIDDEYVRLYVSDNQYR